MSKLKVGDEVMWSGDFGTAPAKKVKVVNIEIDCESKHGNSVEEVDWDDVNSRSVVVDIDDVNDQFWAYGTQIKPVR